MKKTLALFVLLMAMVPARAADPWRGAVAAMDKPDPWRGAVAAAAKPDPWRGTIETAKDDKAKCACGCEQTGKCQCRNCNDHSADKKNPGAKGPAACICGCVETGSCTCKDCNHVAASPRASKKVTCPCNCGCADGDCDCVHCQCPSCLGQLAGTFKDTDGQIKDSQGNVYRKVRGVWECQNARDGRTYRAMDGKWVPVASAQPAPVRFAAVQGASC